MLILRPDDLALYWKMVKGKEKLISQKGSLGSKGEHQRAKYL